MSRFWNWHWKLASRDSNGQCWLSQKVQIIANWSIYCFITTSHNTSYIQGQSILLWIYQEKKKNQTISENNPNQTSRLGCWINNALPQIHTFISTQRDQIPHCPVEGPQPWGQYRKHIRNTKSSKTLKQ